MPFLVRDEKSDMKIVSSTSHLKFLAECGVSVAWRAKPVVRDQTTYTLNHSGLDAMLSLLSAEQS